MNYIVMILECIKLYGENCNFKCNVLCINYICDRFNGCCLVGCKDGEQCGIGLDFKLLILFL